MPVRLSVLVLNFVFRVGAFAVLAIYYLRLAAVGVIVAALMALVLVGAGAFAWDHYLGGGLWYGPSKAQSTAVRSKSDGAASAPKARRPAAGATSGV